MLQNFFRASIAILETDDRYNDDMLGCDKADQLIAYYRISAGANFDAALFLPVNDHLDKVFRSCQIAGRDRRSSRLGNGAYSRFARARS